MANELIGKKLANYEIVSSLGQGGMAQVYRAMDTALKRPAAVKVIASGLSDNTRYRERFEREAQSIAALEHPNIVPVYYFGESDTLYFLAMKFIEGEDLSAILNRYASAGEYLPTADILTILDGIGEALDYAHRKGVIHRDVKPSNIMIDGEGRVYLTDFGLALDLNRGTAGDVFGTPHYIAPEQARSSADAVPQSDLYALGVVLFELLTGVVPFDDPSPTAVALQHITKEPPSPRAINPNLSPQVEAVILKALSKEPAARYPSGKALADALRGAFQNAGSARENVEIPAVPLPALPPGFQAPTPRQMSLRPVAAEVRASLAQRQDLERRITATQRAATPPPTLQSSTQPPPAGTIARPQGRTLSLPLIVLAAVFIVTLGAVGIAALSTTNPPEPTSVAELPTLFTIPTDQPTDQPTDAPTDAPTNEPATLVPATDAPTDAATDSPTSAPTATTAPPTDAPAVAAPVTNTPEPPTSAPTDLPTAAPTVTTVTDIPPTTAPTAYPSDWLPVRFEYNTDSLWWVNESGTTLNVNNIRFENVRRARSLEGNRWALFYSRVEPSGCVVVNGQDADGQMPRPAGCSRTNSEVNANSTENFWRGNDQFRVLWRGIEVGVCDNAAGVCRLAVPPG